jgi:hypothetical protein
MAHFQAGQPEKPGGVANERLDKAWQTLEHWAGHQRVHREASYADLVRLQLARSHSGAGCKRPAPASLALPPT